MENYNMNASGSRNDRDSQSAEEYTGSSANFNQNADENDEQNSNPALKDMENARLDTDPNRYANFNTPGRSGEADAEEENNAGDGERTQFSPEDERRLDTRNAAEENGNWESHARTSAHEKDNDKETDDQKQQFFDGL
jgi:hypothetical protein